MMSSERFYVSVPVRYGEQIRKILSEMNLLDGDFKIISESGTLFLPTTNEIALNRIHAIAKDLPLEIGRRSFEMTNQGPRTLSEALDGRLPSEKLALLPRAYDLVGDIAVLEIPDELASHSKLIGEVFHSIHRNFNVVLAKRGAVSGVTRVRQYDFLSGEERTKTIHTEYGCRLAVDLEKAYFSPRLLEEHNRVAQLVEENEVVIDMFCGVGPFAIHIARLKQAQIIAIDVNPAAIALLKESISLNRLVGSIIPVVADAHEYINDHELHADRVIMNHPSGASNFILDACRILEAGGIIHYYDFIGGDNPENTLTEKICKLIEEGGRSVKQVSTIRRVRDSAPYEYQMVADIILD
ncbi:MAG: class I SAM-dependent methyltransferase family protein [Candidatus Thorarchaeota archaeon]|nr:class I SAM-dependent methyltransferase family protein [Candidatus Thorarchaeota archaeon]